MAVFVYHWEVVNENPIIIRGHCLDECNNYKVIIVDNYYDFCFYDPKINTNDVIYLPTSDNIFENRPFIKKYSKYRQELKGYMSELSIISKFTAVSGLGYTGWVDKEMKPINMSKHPTPLILAFDIEVSSTHNSMVKPYINTDVIEMISCILNRYGEKSSIMYLIHNSDHNIYLPDVITIQCKSELEIIDNFFSLISKLNPDIVTGFNIYGFDFDFIVGKLQYYLHYTTMCSRPDLDHFKIVETDWESSAYGFNKYKKLTIGGRIVFDLMLFFRRFKLERYTLEVISQHFLGEGKENMSYMEMFECFRKRQNLNKVASYCIQDSLLVIKLFNKFNMWNELCETAKIMRCSIEDIYTRGEQLRVTNQIVKECISRNVVMIKRKVEKGRDYKGATVLEPKKGVYENCVMLDFQSLYPSIVIAFNICPSTYKNNFSKSITGLFPYCIKNLLDERKKVKKQMLNITDNIEMIVADKRQNALKVCANSMYGIMGFASNPYFGCIPCAEKISNLGREVLESTIEFIQNNYDVNIIYGDTDSCMLQSSSSNLVELAKIICNDVTSRLPPPMMLNFEEHYNRVILINKKRYVTVGHDDQVKFKGVMIARRGYCQYAKDLYKDVLNMILKDHSVDCIKEYISDSIYQLITKQIKLDKLKMTKSVKDLSSYKTEVPQALMTRRLIAIGYDILPGTRLEYVFAKAESTLQGNKMFTIDEFDTYNLEVDYKYYLEKQVINQLDEILDLIGLKDYIFNVGRSYDIF